MSQYAAGDIVSFKDKDGKRTLSGKIKNVEGRRPTGLATRDQRSVIIVVRWRDMAGREHVTETTIPYWKITARLSE